ncbi:MAG: hypothetical protein FWG69_05035 [Oscillospiraceae bacterium]|nr:hypothetical protein [Oscillospiraceae bacterium]
MIRNRKTNILLRFHRQRFLLLLLAVSLGFILLAGSTYSWFTQSDEAVNILKTQDLRFSFETAEEFTPPQTVETGQNVMKVVNVKNTGDIPGFVRVLVFAEIISDDGTVLEAIPGVTFKFEDLNVTDWTLGSTKMWADGGDGYYYYLNILDTDKTTVQSLFNGVTLMLNSEPEYNDARMKIEIKTEAAEAVCEKYRGGWWDMPDNPPDEPDLIPIDDILQELAK